MRRTGALIIAAVLVLTIPAIIAEDADAEPCSLHFDYLPAGEAWVPATVGLPPIPSNVQPMVDKGTWHYEDGTPWSPEDIVDKNRLNIIIDVRPDPPVPDPPDIDPWPTPTPEPTPTPTPTPTPAPTPTPEPEPSRNEDNATKYALIVTGAGIAVAAVMVLGYFAMRRQ